MNIVVLDGYTLNPGDLTWDDLKELGVLKVYDRTPADQVIERSKDAEIIYTNKTVLSVETLSQLPKLKFIGVLATGYNVVDIEAAKERDIPVCNIPTYGTQSVAQMVFAHILNVVQRIQHHVNTVKQGRWARSQDFCYWDFPLVELAGLNLGIIGYGRIGQATANLGKAFGMNILANDTYQPDKPHEGVRFVDLDELFKESDIVSLHCNLTAENLHMINAERLEQMKPSAILVNTSRGPLVDESALLEALRDKKIYAAGLDVLEMEPPAADNPLYHQENCFITPHISWATKSARSRLMNTAVDNLKSFLDGKVQNRVN